jgi:hypothetical protein
MWPLFPVRTLSDVQLHDISMINLECFGWHATRQRATKRQLIRSIAIIDVFLDAKILKAMLPIPKNILARFNEVLKQQEVHVSFRRQGFHLAMVFSTKGTYIDTGHKRTQTISPAWITGSRGAKKSSQESKAH